MNKETEIKDCLKPFLFVVTLLFVAAGSLRAQEPSFKSELVVVEDYSNPVIGMDHQDVIASDNKTGFETGQVVVQNGIYYMFVGEMFDKERQDMRASLWKSGDGFNWQRVSTLKNSLQYDQSPNNMKKEVWITGASFNEIENRWNIFYIAYTGGIRQYEDPENLRTRDYYGRVFRAASIHLGREGIEGPYEDVDIIMYPEWVEPKKLEGQQHLSIRVVDEKPGEDWEGQQAVASFNPFRLDDESWMAFYGGHWHDPRQSKYIVGLARADHLSGPWVRAYELSPGMLSVRFSENPVVTRLEDGRYIAVFQCKIEDSDSGEGISNANVIGYSISEDGKHWPYRKVINVLPNNDWTQQMRTPLGLIPEKDDVFRVYYTCQQKEKRSKEGGDFFPVGMARVKLVD
jgi:hypothetical protein